MKTEKEIKSMLEAIKAEKTEGMLQCELGGRARAIWALEWVLKDWDE